MVIMTRAHRETSLVGMLRIAPFALAAGLSSCSTPDTVVAVNVALIETPAELSTMEVTITQAGQTPVTAEISPPTEPIDGGTKFKDAFFQRITLPTSWSSGAALVHVDAKSAAGATVASTEVDTDIRHEGVVAVYLSFGTKPSQAPDAGCGVDQDAGT
jgi:hypothetical protein